MFVRVGAKPVGVQVWSRNVRMLKRTGMLAALFYATTPAKERVAQ